MITQAQRYHLQLATVLPYKEMEEFPESVRDQIANAMTIDLPIVFVMYYGGTIGMEPVMDMDTFRELFDKKIYGPTVDAQRLLEPLWACRQMNLTGSFLVR